jgi:hypothetical protein
MTDANAADQGVALSGALMFYNQPEPLNRQAHAKLGLKRNGVVPFRFVAETHILPLLLPEFQQAALSYPIVFMGEPRRPAAVLGVQAGDNLFVSRETGFQPDAYVPYYVRRYPFALANDHEKKTAVVIIDRASDLISENPDAPFFENGEPTALVTDMIEFCEGFEQSRLTTEMFCNLLEELDLFEVRYTDYNARNPDGTPAPPQRVAEYFAVSEEKLNALPADKLQELRDNGALRQIYAHLISLSGWEKLMSLAIARHGVQNLVPANNG